MDTAIERASSQDFLDVAALDRMAWPKTPGTYIPDGEHVWRVWSEYAILLVTRDTEVLPESGNISGALVMFPTTTEEFFLHKIMVHPGRRGAGLGTALMEAALEIADRDVLLTVDPANTAAVQLYERCGFRRRAHVPGFYRPHESRDVMVYSPTPQT